MRIVLDKFTDMNNTPHTISLDFDNVLCVIQDTNIITVVLPNCLIRINKDSTDYNRYTEDGSLIVEIGEVYCECIMKALSDFSYIIKR